MFGMTLIVSQIQAEIALAEQERKMIDRLRLALPPEEFSAWLAKHEAEKREAHDRRTEERRHQETCEAIRSTSFWRFGR